MYIFLAGSEQRGQFRGGIFFQWHWKASKFTWLARNDALDDACHNENI
jgi:hypothetical protein